MPRQITWLPRLKRIHDRVSSDARTAWTTGDIGDLFGLKAAAARALVSLMPRSLQAGNPIVAREDLYEWIGACIDAEDVPEHLSALRKSPPAPSRKKYRIPAPYSMETKPLSTLRTKGIWIERGRLVLDWTTLPDFLAKMHQLIEVVATSPELERRYCYPLPPSQRPTREAAIEHDNAWFRAERAFTSAIEKGFAVSARGDRKRTSECQAQACAAYAEMQRICSEDGLELDQVYVDAHAKLCADSVD